MTTILESPARTSPGTAATAPTGVKTQVTNNTLSEHSVSIDGNNILWVADDGVDDEVFLHSFDPNTGFGATFQLTDDAADDIDPHISGNNVVWQGLVGTNWEIFWSARTGKSSTATSPTPPRAPRP